MRAGGFVAVFLTVSVLLLGIFYMYSNEILFTDAVLTEISLTMNQIYYIIIAVVLIMTLIAVMVRMFTR